MQLPQPFIRLALTVDADRLRSEIAQFGPGNGAITRKGTLAIRALPLVAGVESRTTTASPDRWAATPQLARCPYCPAGPGGAGRPARTNRLMRLDAGAEATAHVDTNYYWSQRVRVHMPIVTTPGVRFLCGDAQTHMAPGEVWIFDTWRLHNVLNPPGVERIHLVVDTVGSDAFWGLARDQGKAAARPLRSRTRSSADMETVNFPS